MASLRQFFSIIGCNKKSFCNLIALNKLFVVKFLFAVDQRSQHWLGMCKCATGLRSHVDNRVLQFNNIIKDMLKRSFNMTPPATFKKF